MKWLILFIIIVLIIICSIIILFFQERLLFYPKRKNKPTQASGEDIFMTMRDGVKLHSVLFKAPNSHGLILYFHGNTGNILRFRNICHHLIAMNYDCIVIDYRGFGRSEGHISSQNQWYNDAEDIYKTALLYSNNKPFYLYGYSIGSTMAAYLSSIHRVAGVILEAAPYSIEQIVKDKFPYLPLQYVLKYPFYNNTYLSKNTNSTVVLHGTNDRLVPYKHLLMLQKELSDDHSFVTIEGGTHNNLWDFDNTKAVIYNFLNTHNDDIS